MVPRRFYVTEISVACIAWLPRRKNSGMAKRSSLGSCCGNVTYPGLLCRGKWRTREVSSKTTSVVLALRLACPKARKEGGKSRLGDLFPWRGGLCRIRICGPPNDTDRILWMMIVCCQYLF